MAGDSEHKPLKPAHPAVKSIAGTFNLFCMFVLFRRGRPSALFPRQNHLAGSIGGAAEACCLQPIDVIKTRLQLDHIGKYKGGVLCKNARKLCISTDGGLLLFTSLRFLPVCLFAHVNFYRHIPLRRDNHQGRRCQGFVEGAHALCSASHLEVCSAHGYKRNVPKRASGRGMQGATCHRYFYAGWPMLCFTHSLHACSTQASCKSSRPSLAPANMLHTMHVKSSYTN